LTPEKERRCHFFNQNLKYWEIIADNLKKAGWSWGYVSAVDPRGEQSGLQTHIEITESVSSCARMKS
jgi:hypothetical protein